MIRNLWVRVFALLAAVVWGPCVPAHAAQVRVSWVPLPPSTGVVGYRVCFGPESQTSQGFWAYPEERDVGDVAQAVVVVPDQVTYFAVVTYNAARFESGYSNELRWEPGAAPVRDPGPARHGFQARDPRFDATEAAPGGRFEAGPRGGDFRAAPPARDFRR